MPSTEFPLPVSVDTVAAYFTGVGAAFRRGCRRAAPRAGSDALAVEAAVTKQLRRALSRLEELAVTPFFVTRYCTRELAAQLNLTQGADYDQLVPALSYLGDQWRDVSARLELPRVRVRSVDSFRLTLEHNGKIADVPADWINRDDDTGTVHLLPQALTSLSATFFSVFALHPQLYRTGLSRETPLMVHLRFSAGIVERETEDGDPYDPEAYPLPTVWPQGLATEYQQALAEFAAGQLMSQVAGEVVRGGVQASIDGMSRSVNAGVLPGEAARLIQKAEDWAREQNSRTGGLAVAFA